MYAHWQGGHERRMLSFRRGEGLVVGGRRICGLWRRTRCFFMVSWDLEKYPTHGSARFNDSSTLHSDLRREESCNSATKYMYGGYNEVSKRAAILFNKNRPRVYRVD